MKRILTSLLAATLLAVSLPAHAGYDVTAKVVNIEPSYTPDMVLFKLDAAIGTCGAGQWVYYYGTYYSPTDAKKNVQAVYTALLYALASGKKVEVHSEAAGCVVVNVHPTNQ